MRKTLIPLALAAAASLASFAGTAAAAGAEASSTHWHHGEGRLEHLLDTVNASDAQRTQIKAIHEKYEPQMHDLHQQLHDIHRQAEALDPTSSSYLSQADAYADKAGPIVAQIGKVKARLHHEIAGVLSADQLAKLKEAKANWLEEHHFGPPMDD